MKLGELAETISQTDSARRARQWRLDNPEKQDASDAKRKAKYHMKRVTRRQSWYAAGMVNIKHNEVQRLAAKGLDAASICVRLGIPMSRVMAAMGKGST